MNFTFFYFVCIQVIIWMRFFLETLVIVKQGKYWKWKHHSIFYGKQILFLVTSPCFIARHLCKHLSSLKYRAFNQISEYVLVLSDWTLHAHVNTYSHVCACLHCSTMNSTLSFWAVTAEINIYLKMKYNERVAMNFHWRWNTTWLFYFTFVCSNVVTFRALNKENLLKILKFKYFFIFVPPFLLWNKIEKKNHI